MAIEVIDDEAMKAINHRIRDVISHTLDCGYGLDKNGADGMVRFPTALLPDFIRVRMNSPRLRDKFEALFDRYQHLKFATDNDESTIKEYIVAASELLFWCEVMSVLKEWAASN